MSNMRAFSGEVDAGFPQKMRPTHEAGARLRFHQIETRSSTARMTPLAAAGLLLGLSAGMAPATAQQSIEERRACAPDVMRLCREFVPNTEMINTCLMEKKAELSPGCRTVMFGTETDVTPAIPAKQQPVSKPEKPKIIKVKTRKTSHDCE
jgi:hypothetical protein